MDSSRAASREYDKRGMEPVTKKQKAQKAPKDEKIAHKARDVLKKEPLSRNKGKRERDSSEETDPFASGARRKKSSYVTGSCKQVRGKIAPTYTKGGKLATDKKASTNRLFLGDRLDSRFSVGIVDEKKVAFESREARLSRDASFVRINITDKTQGPRTVVVSVKELADRLHISKKEIRQEAANGFLETFLEKKQQSEFSRLPEVIKEYETIFTQYEERNKELIYRRTNTSVGLTKKQLMKVVRCALLNKEQSPFFSSPKSVAAKITLQSMNPGAAPPLASGVQITVDKHQGIAERKFVAIQEPGKSLYIVQDPSEGAFINEGTHGAVMRIQNISQASIPSVIKRTKLTDEGHDRSPQEIATSAAVITEGAVLCHKIHRELQHLGRSSEGIMSAPFAIVDIREKKGRPLTVGWIGKEYTQGDAMDFLFSLRKVKKRPTPFEFATAGLRALQGVAALHSIHRPHRDIKSENLLVSLGPHNELQLDIGDLDTCKKIEEIDFDEGEFKQIRGGICTPELVLIPDLLSVYNAIDDYKAEKDESIKIGLKAEILDMYIARDKFAMGATLYEWLTGTVGKLPYDLDSRHFPKLSQPFTIDRQPLEKNGYPPKFIDGLIPILENMLNPDWTQRSMSLQECAQAFATLINAHLRG